VADSKLSGRQKALLVSVAIGFVPLFVALKLTSGGVHWVLIAVGVAIEASLAVFGVIASRRDRA
jgi:hypothetical protein